jgi:hypothetical protein
VWRQRELGTPRSRCRHVSGRVAPGRERRPRATVARRCQSALGETLALRYMSLRARTRPASDKSRSEDSRPPARLRPSAVRAPSCAARCRRCAAPHSTAVPKAQRRNDDLYRQREYCLPVLQLRSLGDLRPQSMTTGRQ